MAYGLSMADWVTKDGFPHLKIMGILAQTGGLF